MLLAKTAKAAAHDALASLEAIFSGESGGRKKIRGFERRRCRESGSSEKSRTPLEVKTCKEQESVNKFTKTSTN